MRRLPPSEPNLSPSRRQRRRTRGARLPAGWLEPAAALLVIGLLAAGIGWAMGRYVTDAMRDAGAAATEPAVAEPEGKPEAPAAPSRDAPPEEARDGRDDVAGSPAPGEPAAGQDAPPGRTTPGTPERNDSARDVPGRGSPPAGADLVALPEQTLYVIQLGAFRQRTGADALLPMLAEAGLAAAIVELDGWRAWSGLFRTREAAEAAAERYADAGFDVFIRARSLGGEVALPGAGASLQALAQRWPDYLAQAAALLDAAVMLPSPAAPLSGASLAPQQMEQIKALRSALQRDTQALQVRADAAATAGAGEPWQALHDQFERLDALLAGLEDAAASAGGLDPQMPELLGRAAEVLADADRWFARLRP